MNQCTDQLVLALLPPTRIASVSALARDRAGSLLFTKADRVAVNHGAAEEVLAQRPDLVVTGAFTTPALRGMLKRLNYPMIEVKHANSFAEIRRITRQVAQAVGEPARGEALIANMDATLAELARRPAPPVRTVAWDRTGFAAAGDTLLSAILDAAGVRNLAGEGTALGYHRPDVEMLLRADPALLVQGSGNARIAGAEDEILNHRAVRGRWAGRTFFLRQAFYTCGAPGSVEGARLLRNAVVARRDRS